MKNFRTVSIVLASLFAFTLYGCDKGKTASAPTPAPAPKTASAPEAITFTKPALYPEGVDWDAANKRFLVTSIHEGIVGAVTDDGRYTVFAKDPRMVSAVGIRIDAARDRVLVCNADPGASLHSSPQTTGKLAGLAVFRLSTGELIQYLDLAKGLEGSHFCNDIALDKDGTAYVSDSFSPVIYKVDPQYNVSVFINNKQFNGVGFNLNGLVVKDNYLLVVKYNDGTLFKFPMDNPKAFTQVKIDQKFHGADGLLWAPDGTLVLIANDSAHGGSIPAIKTDKVFKLKSMDNWESAIVVGSVDTGDVFATTGVVRDGKIYVMYAMLQVLFNPKTKTHTEKFEIHQQKL